jgi:hypothetical protein|nr:MAG TPA: hypothetical protein [Caudoviricetes sp.]
MIDNQQIEFSDYQCQSILDVVKALFEIPAVREDFERWKVDGRRDALMKEIEEAERNDMYAENRLLPTDEG